MFPIYLVHRLNDPVDPSVATYGLVLGIHQNDFEVFVCGVLIDPVRVQHPEVRTAAADTFFGGGLKGALILQLVDTLVCGFALKEGIVSDRIGSG